MLNDERPGAFERLLDLAVADAVDRVRRHHPGACRTVLATELVGELRLAGVPEEHLDGPLVHRALDALCAEADDRQVAAAHPSTLR